MHLKQLQATKDEPESRTRVVVHLIASNFAGGPEKQIVEHASRLEGSGWRPIVGSFRENRDKVDVVEVARQQHIETFLVDTKFPHSPLAILQLRNFLIQKNVDILIAHGYKSHWVGRLACALERIPCVPFVRGFTAENWRVRRYEAMDRWLLRRAELILTVSYGYRDRLVQYGVAKDKVEVVRNAIDYSRTSRITACDLRAECGLQGDGPIIVAAGRLSPEKGHRDLILAMNQLNDAGIAASLVILGEGSERPALEKLVEKHLLSSRVILAGFKSSILQYLAAANVVVNPSHSEGMPNVVLEALALGRPVVATDVGGVRELVIPGETGLLVPPRSPSQLADGIRDCLKSTDRSHAMALQGAQHVRTHFSFDDQARRLVSIYERALR